MVGQFVAVSDRDTDVGRKQTLLTELEGEYRRFASVVAGVNARDFRDRWLDGRCGVAEVVAIHIGCLDRLCATLQLGSGGTPFEQIDWLDGERWEEMFYPIASGKSKKALLKELREAFDRLIRAAADLAERRYRESIVTTMISYLAFSKFRLHASLVEAWQDGRLRGTGERAA